MSLSEDGRYGLLFYCLRLSLSFFFSGKSAEPHAIRMSIKRLLFQGTNLKRRLSSGANPVNSEKSVLSLAIKWFARSVAIILFVTAAAKIFSVYRSGGSVTAMDPVFTFARADVLLVLVALLEIFCGILLCLFGKQGAQLLLIIWLSALFLTYRVGLLLVGYSGPCSCFGKPQSWLNFPFFASLDVIMKWILAYMLILSCLLFGVLMRKNKARLGR
jgi:hypothetical protein